MLLSLSDRQDNIKLNAQFHQLSCGPNYLMLIKRYQCHIYQKLEINLIFQERNILFTRFLCMKCNETCSFYEIELSEDDEEVKIAIENFYTG